MLRAELRAALIVATSLVGTGAPAATCPLDAVDAFEAARAADFTFRMIQSNDVFCRFAVFGGRSAENGWRLVRLIYSFSQNAEVEVTRLPAGWLFDIRAPRAQTSLVSVKRVVARGKKCKDWREAFNSDE